MKYTAQSLSVLLISIILVFFVGVWSDRAAAFGPAAHYVIMEQVAQGLPQDSAIRQAMLQHKEIAGVAASGPDIPYCQLRGALGYAPWADRYHYDRVGTFAKEQLRKALTAHDAVQLAWAAGWVTHVMGDMAGHGMYVNPEAGVYLENKAGRGMHKQLEAASEVAVWVEVGGYPQDSYNKDTLPKKFCGNSAIPLSLLEDTSSQVFGRSPGKDYRTWYQLFKTGLSMGIGYSYETYAEAQKFLSESDRKQRLTQAVQTAVQQAIALLRAAEQGDYSGFNDTWNLDAGREERPFGTLTVTIHTGENFGAGTDADIHFGMVFADGTTKDWLLDKEGYNDFERGDDDDYYLFLAEKNLTPAAVKMVYLKMGKELGVGVAWRPTLLKVYVNGTLAFDNKVDKWLNQQGDKWESTAWKYPVK